MKVSNVAIHGLDGGPWGSSAGFVIDPAEMIKTLTMLGDDDAQKRWPPQGVVVAGERFTYLRHGAYPHQSILAPEV